MKRILAVLLGLFMLLGYAAVASAEYTIDGRFVAKFYTPISNPGHWDLDIYKDSRLEMELKGAYGPASGNLKFRIGFERKELDKDLTSSIALRTASWQYQLGKSLSLGIVLDPAGENVLYQSPICADYAWTYRMANHGANKYDAAFVGQFRTANLSFIALTDLMESDPMWLYSSASLKSNRFALGCAFEYFAASGGVKAEYTIQPSMTLALTPKLKLGAEAYYASAPATAALGAGFAYTSEKATLTAGAYYDFGAKYWAFIGFDAAYKLTNNINVYATYYEKGSSTLKAELPLGLEAGTTFYFGPGKKESLDIAYNEPKNSYEFEFIIKF